MKNESDTSLALLRRLCDPRDSDAWRRFVKQYRPMIERWCQPRWSPVEVDDVVGDVLLRLVRSIDTYRREKGRFRPWLKTVVRSTLIDRLRLDDRRLEKPAVGGDSALAALQQVKDTSRKEDSPRDEDSADGLEQLVSTLSAGLSRDWADVREATARVRPRVKDTTWRAFVLHKLHGETAAVVAEQLKISKAAVYQAAHRVVTLLRREIEELRSHDRFDA